MMSNEKMTIKMVIWRKGISMVFWFGLEKCRVPSKPALSPPILSWTGERKYDERLKG